MAISLKNYEPALQEGADIIIVGNIQGATITATSGFVGNLTGNVTGNISGSTIVGSTQTLTGAGAVSVSTLVTEVVTTGVNALTLADGVDGQLKIIAMKTDGGDGTLTPTTKTGFSTITFNDAGDGVTLVFTTTTGWICVGNNGATLA